MFAKIANIDYLFLSSPPKTSKLPFFVSICSKQKEVCCFRFLFKANNQKLIFYVSSVFPLYIYKYMQKKKYIYIIFIHIYKYTYIYTELQSENGKRKPRRFSLISLPLVYRTNGSVSFVQFLKKTLTKVIRLQTD